MFGWLRRLRDLSTAEPLPRIAAAEIPWDRVVTVVAYKADLLTTDEIVLELIDCDDKLVARCDESSDAWFELVETINRLPGAREDWWQAVAFPAFETCWTVVWERGDVGTRPAD